jgi:hypothetical protein
MNCSSEEAVGLFNRWREQQSLLSCVFYDRSFGEKPTQWYVQGACFIHEVGEQLVIGFTHHSTFRVRFDFILKYEFNTGMDVSAHLRSAVTHDNWLALYLPSNLIILLGEKS